MPKRKKEKKESELEEEIKETGLHKVNEVLKKTSESQEMSEVLKKTSEEIIEDNEFHEFMKPLEKSFSPVLERIEAPQQNLLEENSSFTPIAQEKKHEKQIKYNTGYNPSEYEAIGEEKRKIQNENMIMRFAPIRVETNRMDLHPQIEQNFQINPELLELRRKSEGNLEKDYVLKTKKLDRENNRLPFEQKERKYRGKAI